MNNFKNETHDALLDAPLHELNEAAHADDQRNEWATAQADDVLLAPLNAHHEGIISEYLSEKEWNEEHYEIFDSVLVKIALGQPVTPDDIIKIITRDEIHEKIANDIYENQ